METCEPDRITAYGVFPFLILANASSENFRVTGFICAESSVSSNGASSLSPMIPNPCMALCRTGGMSFFTKYRIFLFKA
jgi:hypothetical protein